MRLLSLCLLLTFLVSCGKKSSSSQPGSDPTVVQEEEDRTSPVIDGDGMGTELLDAMVDVPVNVSGSEIKFLKAANSASKGRQIECKVGVKLGEVYQYSLSGNSLTLNTGTTSYNMKRLNDGSGLRGVWVWKGNDAASGRTERLVTFVNEHRAVLRSNCEI